MYGAAVIGAIAAAVRLACARTSGWGSSSSRSAHRSASPDETARSVSSAAARTFGDASSVMRGTCRAASGP